jgi:hypothetical protein
VVYFIFVKRPPCITHKINTAVTWQPEISGGDGERVTPVPIPNTEVKPFCADGTWRETSRESRSLPDLKNTQLKNALGVFLFQNLFIRPLKNHFYFRFTAPEGAHRLLSPSALKIAFTHTI